MKNRLLLVIALLALTASVAQASVITSSADPALAGSTLIDFNNQVTGSYNSLSIGNVTFGGSGPINVTNSYGGEYNTDGIHLDNSEGSTYTMNFSFDDPVSAFGFNLGASDYTWMLRAYSGNTLLESYAIPATHSSNAGEFFGIAADGITSASLVSSSYDWVLLDNFTYNSSEPVPEPSTIFLLGAGLAGLAFVRRKSNKS